MDGPMDVTFTGEESAAMVTILMVANLACVTLKGIVAKTGSDLKGEVAEATDYLQEQINLAIQVIAERQNGEHDTILELSDASDEPAMAASEEDLLEHGFTDEQINGATIH